MEGSRHEATNRSDSCADADGWRNGLPVLSVVVSRIRVALCAYDDLL